MAAAVEWDRVNNRALTIRDANGEERATGMPRDPNATTEWLPVVVDYPPGFVDRFAHLLGDDTTYAYSEADGKVHRSFPSADFSEAAVRRELERQVDAMQREALQYSDPAVLEALETGKNPASAVPPEVRQLRAQVRAEAARAKGEIARLRGQELLDYEVSVAMPRAKPYAPVRNPPQPASEPMVTNATGPGQEGKPVRPAAKDEIAKDS